MRQNGFAWLTFAKVLKIYARDSKQSREWLK
jgi:hypothetical protein